MYLYDCTLFSILLPTSFLLCIPLPYPIWSFSIICCYRVIYYRILLFWSHSYLIWSYLYVELAVFLQNCKTIYLSIWLFLLWLRMQRLFELFRRPTVILPYWNTIYYNDYIYIYSDYSTVVTSERTLSYPASPQCGSDTDWHRLPSAIHFYLETIIFPNFMRFQEQKSAS